MTPRPLARTPRAAALTLAVAGLIAVVGCDPRQAAFFLQPFEPKIGATCPPLKGKRVAVVARIAPGASADFVTIDREMARELTTILRENVKKIDLVDAEQVAAWCRANPTWTDPADLARAFEADVVIDLQIVKFEVDNPSSPGLFEGKSSVHVRVTEWAHPKDDRGREQTDQPKQANVIHETDRDTAFPITGGIPVSADVSRATFKNKFLQLVATEISWNFVGRAPGDNIQDTRFN